MGPQTKAGLAATGVSPITGAFQSFGVKNEFRMSHQTVLLKNEDGDFPEEIQRLVRRLELQDKTYDLKLGGKTLEFDVEDQIFQETEKAGKGMPSDMCAVCQAKIKSNKKLFCEFCCQRACDKCIYKKREFKAKDTDSTNGNQDFVPVYQTVATEEFDFSEFHNP